MAGLSILDFIYENEAVPMFEDMKLPAQALRADKKNGAAWLELERCFRSRLDHVRIERGSERWQKMLASTEEVYERALQELPDHQDLRDAHAQLLAYRDA